MDEARERAKKKAARKRLSTRIHRWLGMASLVIVLVISVTGLVLNHTESLKLNERRITSGPVLGHYGMEPAGAPSVFRTDGHVLAVWDGQLIFDETIVDLAPGSASLVGAGPIREEEFAFVFPSLIVVCDTSGGLLDRLDEASLPRGKIRRAGAVDNAAVVEMESGDRFILKEWLEIVDHQGPEPDWFEGVDTISGEERERLKRAFRSDGLPLSRILIDLHSGRFFGTVGVILYDLAAVALVVLGITGVQLWFRRRYTGRTQ